VIKTGTYISVAEPSRADRFRRLESLAWLLDNSILLPGGYRIGVDALIGLIPGLGDAIGALFSAFILNEARLLGAPRSVLWRMTANVMMEAVVGAVPFAGDLFDAAYKANSRNLALLKRYEGDPAGSRRSSRLFIVGFGLLSIAMLAAIVAVPVLLLVWIAKLF
jgi:hypothetical protein